MQVTISAIKADIGGIGGHTRPSEELLETVRDFVIKNAKGLLIDHYIGYTGDVYTLNNDPYSRCGGRKNSQAGVGCLY